MCIFSTWLKFISKFLVILSFERLMATNLDSFVFFQKIETLKKDISFWLFWSNFRSKNIKSKVCLQIFNVFKVKSPMPDYHNLEKTHKNKFSVVSWTNFLQNCVYKVRTFTCRAIGSIHQQWACPLWLMMLARFIDSIFFHMKNLWPKVFHRSEKWDCVIQDLR